VTDALTVAEAALAQATGDEVEAVVQSERSGLARFSGSEVSQPTLISNLGVGVRVVRDGRLGYASTNRVSTEGLRDAARRAGEAADSAPADPSFPGLPEPEPLPEVAGFDDETAALRPEDQARLATAAIAGAGGLEAFGFFTSGVTEIVVANTHGLRAHQRSTDATTLVLAAAEHSSGYAEATAWQASAIDPAAVGAEAAAKAGRTRGARELEPGTYAAVLEPYALGELLDYFAFDSFNGLGLLEERSALSGRLGERIFDPRVSIADDALDPRGLPKAFDFEGTPKRRVVLVEDGIARGVVWDRSTAAHAVDGTHSTGHALPAELSAYGPMPTALCVAPGDASSADELAERVGEGVYVTRLHYLSIVEPREGLITGMTRDGTFRIRGGRVAEPLVNLRFTVSVPRLLANVPGLTREVTLVNPSEFYGERYPYGALVPALATGCFTVTGVGSGPGL
jgi:predicted Zn-dependent protease